MLDDVVREVTTLRSRILHRPEVAKVIHDVRSQPLLFVTFMLNKMLAYCIFFGNFMFLRSFKFAGLVMPTSIMFICTYAAFCAVCIYFVKHTYIFARSQYLPVIFTLLIGGVVLLALDGLGLAPQASNVFFYLGMLLASIGSMGIHMELGRLFGMLGMGATLTYGVASELAAMPFGLLVLALSAPLKWFAVILIALLCCALFPRTCRSAFPERGSLYKLPGSDLLIPHRFVITSFVQGLIMGMPIGCWSLSANFSDATLPAIVSTGIASILTMETMLRIKVDFNRSIYQIGFSLSGIGLMLMGILGPSSVFALLLQCTGFFYLDLICWGLGSYLIRSCNQDAIWVCAFPTGALKIGEGMSIALGCVLRQVGNPPQVSSAFYVLAVLVLLSGLLLSNGENIRSGWGFIKPGEPEEGAGIIKVCKYISQEFHFTPRELEILIAIMEGKSRKEIADALFVTQNTVKTHTHNLYGKLDVHSTSELKKYVTDYEKMLHGTDEVSIS
jgi:DNA-binding CsgD family transcriptional regulator